MKVTLNIVACIICAITTVYAITSDLDNLTIISRILFKFFLLLSFVENGKIKITRMFVGFLLLVFSADIFSFFAANLNEQLVFYIGCIFSAMYLLLFLDAWKQFKMNRVNYPTWSFIGVLSLNALLLGLHLSALIGGFKDSFLLIMGQTIYNVMLYIVIAIAIAYYLNSYSKKSMLFLLGTIAFLCSDILYGSHYFYGVGAYILPFSVLLSVGGYVFIFSYFQIEEEPLLLESDILMEIEAIEKRKVKHRV